MADGTADFKEVCDQSPLYGEDLHDPFGKYLGSSVYIVECSPCGLENFLVVQSLPVG